MNVKENNNDEGADLSNFFVIIFQTMENWKKVIITKTNYLFDGTCHIKETRNRKNGFVLDVMIIKEEDINVEIIGFAVMKENQVDAEQTKKWIDPVNNNDDGKMIVIKNLIHHVSFKNTQKGSQKISKGAEFDKHINYKLEEIKEHHEYLKYFSVFINP